MGLLAVGNFHSYSHPSSHKINLFPTTGIAGEGGAASGVKVAVPESSTETIKSAGIAFSGSRIRVLLGRESSSDLVALSLTPHGSTGGRAEPARKESVVLLPV